MHSDVDSWAAIGGVLSVQCLIFMIVLVKYGGDILDVFCRNRGHLEYNSDGNTEGVKELQHPKRRKVLIKDDEG